MGYTINKGVGKNVEFKGLQAQYLIIFVLGLVLIFLVFVVMYMAGIPMAFCLIFTLSLTSVLVWLTFRLNRRFGPHGLMKLAARNSRPRFISRRAPIYQLLKKEKKHEKHIENSNTGE